MRLKSSAPQAHAPTKGGGSIPVKGTRVLPQQSQKHPARAQAQKTVPSTRTRSSTASAAKPKEARAKSGDVALTEIRKYQRSTEQLLRKAPFYRLIKEITQDFKTAARFQANAMAALQEAAEAYLTKEMSVYNLNAIHARRITIMPKDINLRKQTQEIDGVALHSVTKNENEAVTA